MRELKENDPNFKNKGKDLQEVNMMNKSQIREMEEIEAMEIHHLHTHPHHHLILLL